MARNFDDANNERLELGSAPVGAYPWSFACWFRTDQNATDEVLMGIGRDGSTDNFVEVRYLGSAAASSKFMRLRTKGGGTEAATIEATLSIDDTNWHHVAIVMTSASDRTIYIDGGNSAGAGDSSTPVSLDVTDIGGSNIGTFDSYWSGDIEDAAFWSGSGASLSAAEVLSLSQGFTAQFVKPANLAIYLPMVRGASNGDEVDIVGGNTFSSQATSGQVGVADGPGLVRPAPAYMFANVAAAGGGGGGGGEATGGGLHLRMGLNVGL